MDIGNSPRHTRRGFLRGDSAPKFFPLVPLNASAAASVPVMLPPRSSASVVTPSYVSHLPPPPPAVFELLDEVEPPMAPQDFTPPQDAFFAALQAAESNNSSNPFLAWLADQLADQATRERLLEADDDDGDLANSELAEDFLEEFSDFSQVWRTEDVVQAPVSEPENPFARAHRNPAIELTVDGGRCETFAAGSQILKDGLGRVIEVRSQFGDCLYFKYGELGHLEHFERTDVHGRVHSQGHKDKHGVVVRDYEGRVRAAGETMAVDPRGCFYVHTFDGQYNSLDLVTGIHVERRKVKDNMAGTTFVITSLFTHDGFRMATIFSGMIPAGSAPADRACLLQPIGSQELRFRFYGRDGTLIEFASEDELRRLQPVKVSPPAARKVSRTWQKKRQAGTAWDSVHEYLMRVS